MPNYSRSRTRESDVLKTLVDIVTGVNNVKVDRYIYTDIIKAFGVLSSMQPNSLIFVHTGTQYRDTEPFTRINCTLLLSGRNAGSMADASNSNMETADAIVDMLDNITLGKATKKVLVMVESKTAIKFSENSLESGYEIKITIDDNGEDI